MFVTVSPPHTGALMILYHHRSRFLHFYFLWAAPTLDDPSSIVCTKPFLVVVDSGPLFLVSHGLAA